jgi:hypothetical protein
MAGGKIQDGIVGLHEGILAVRQALRPLTTRTRSHIENALTKRAFFAQQSNQLKPLRVLPGL